MASEAPVRHSIPFPDPSHGPWVVEIDFGLLRGRIECVGFAMRASGGEPAEPMTTALLRQVPLGKLISRARDDFDDDLFALVKPMLPRGFGQTLNALRDVGLGPLAVEHKGPGRKPKQRSHFEEVTKIYLLGQDSPTKAVSEHFHVSRSTAANWVRTARGYGFIAPTSQGRKSGLPPEPST